MITLELSSKTESSLRYAKKLIKAGWNRTDALAAAQRLWNLSGKRMKEIERRLP
jgi:hypothetical protein